MRRSDLHGEQDQDGLCPRARVLVELARVSAPVMSPLQRKQGLRAVNAQIAAHRRRVPRLIAGGVLGAMTAATAVFVLLRPVALPPATPGGPQTSVQYQIDGGEIGFGGYVRRIGPRGTVLRFSEGTELRLLAGARGRLGAIDAHGARFAIEEGEARVKVTPRPGARWLVDAGPFLITVQGTAFSAAWDGARERLDVRLYKGQVTVSGPLTTGVITMRAGQRLTVNVREKEVLLKQEPPELEPENPTPPAALEVTAPRSPSIAAPVPAAPALRVAATRSRRAAGEDLAPRRSGAARRAEAAEPPPAGRPGPTRSWSAALAAGDLDAVLEGAERRGLASSLAQASSDDLAALADAARYRKRNDVARQALLALRERFPETRRARDAAFLLGRIEESEGSPEARLRAIGWYDQYLGEASNEAFASEALGRKMIALERLRGPAAARPLAEEYLRRFSRGTYAGAARAMKSADHPAEHAADRSQ